MVTFTDTIDHKGFMAKSRVANEHTEYYQNNKFIEFEELLNITELSELNGLIDAALSERLKTPFHQIEKQPADALVKAGTDLWRYNAKLKKFICNKWWAEIASDLSRQRVIRMAADQLLLAEAIQDKEIPLEKRFSFQGLACGLLLCLRSFEEITNATIISHQPGSGVFIDPSMILTTGTTPSLNERQLLILFGGPSLIYLHNSKDLNTHFAKSLGYVFGDKLKDRTHPTLFRAT